MTIRLRRQASFGRKGACGRPVALRRPPGTRRLRLGLLVVLTIPPTVPLDDQAVTVISVGLPVALAVYCGWLEGIEPDNQTLVGLGTVLSAAILGAWLGYHVSAPSLGAVTGTLAAVAAANLGLIVLEVAGIDERPVTVPSIAIPPIAIAAAER